MPPQGAACRLFWAWINPLLFLPYKPDSVYCCSYHRLPGIGADSLLTIWGKGRIHMKIVVVKCKGVTSFVLRKMFKIKKVEDWKSFPPAKSLSFPGRALFSYTQNTMQISGEKRTQLAALPALLSCLFPMFIFSNDIKRYKKKAGAFEPTFFYSIILQEYVF